MHASHAQAKPRHDRRATQGMIAQIAGCSRMTVSLALRHDPQVSASTRERIEKIAHEIGYEPDAAMHALMAQVRAKAPAPFRAALAALHMVSRSAARRMHCYSEWLAGAADRAAELGYTIDDLWIADGNVTPAQLEGVLTTRAIRGLLLPCLANAPALPSGFHFLLDCYAGATAGYPAVSLPALAGAANDRFATGTALFERARAAGCARIGVVIAGDTEPLTDERFSTAILAAAHRERPPVHALPTLVCGADGRRDFRAWFSTFRPDCIITALADVREWLHDLGAVVPRDVSFLFWHLEDVEADWSGARQNDRAVGAAAVDVIVGQIVRGERGTPRVRTRVMVESSFISGATLRR